MASLKEVRGRIVSVNSTQQITKAMKMVAAAKLKRAQDNIIKIRPYTQKLDEILHNITSSLDSSFENQYSVTREPEKILLVVVTSDRGLAGAFNTNIIKATNYFLENHYREQHNAGNVTLLCIGKKGADAFKKRSDVKVINDYATLFSDLVFDNVRKAAEYAMDSFVKGEYDKVEIVYNEFKNAAVQVVRRENFLPLVDEEKEEGQEEQNAQGFGTDYIFEPSKTEIVNELIPKSLKIQFYKALLESNASEHGARMTAMDKATENAKELLKELRLSYNRTRQAAITTEILEIVGGAEALNA
ncbi:ATP synthase F1 subunit gamma [Cytophagaceae bacterium ABcell3]|nr:ATP synthase F1 subunit gamma [Cytophagaceae bacterium ABcell3]